MQEEKKKNERVIVYIDGFNLYFGMMDAGFERCRWLNLKKLVENLLHSNQELIEIRYFTSRVSDNPDKQKRQSTYLEALQSIGIKIIYGHYQDGSETCYRCGHVWRSAKEKMTDVNIATSMIIDAFQDRYDAAMLITGDSDLVPPIRAIHENFNNKRVFVAFPPKRQNTSVQIAANGSFTIGRKKLVDSQFEAEVFKRDGYKLTIPEEWK